LRICLHIIIILIAAFISTGDVHAQKKRKKRKTRGKELSYEASRKFEELFFEAAKEKMLGNLEEAAVIYHECIKINPKDPTPYYEIGNIIFASKQPADALPFSIRALELEPSNEWFALFLAENYIVLNDYQSAVKVYEELTERSPEKVEFQYELATTYLYLNKLEEAIAAYDKIEEKLGVSPDISVQKEKIYLQLDRLDDAVREIENLISNFPGEQQFLGMLAEVYVANDLLEKANSVYQRMLKNKPDDPILHLNLAEYYKKKGNYDASYDELRQAFASF